MLIPGGLLLVAFHIGDETIHLDEWWGHPVSVDFFFLRPDEIARFLCGLNSPLLTQAKLNKHAKFGSLAEVPFQRVMKTAEMVVRQKPIPSLRKRPVG